jgi:stage V sporulation protein G
MLGHAVMNITEVRIFQKESDDKKLRAFATVTFDDCFVVRDIKIIEGSKGFFVAMPSRRVKEPCPRCRHRNILRSRYCNQCGSNIEASSHPGPSRDFHEAREARAQMRQNEHRDIAHPITAEFRETIQRAVLEAYEKSGGALQEQVASRSERSSSPR